MTDTPCCCRLFFSSCFPFAAEPPTPAQTAQVTRQSYCPPFTGVEERWRTAARQDRQDSLPSFPPTRHKQIMFSRCAPLTPKLSVGNTHCGETGASIEEMGRGKILAPQAVVRLGFFWRVRDLSRLHSKSLKLPQVFFFCCVFFFFFKKKAQSNIFQPFTKSRGQNHTF